HSNGHIVAHLDSPTGTAIADITVVATETDWAQLVYNTQSAPVTATDGVHGVYLVTTGGEGVADMDYLSFGKAGAGSINGTVFNDKNSNGFKNATDNPIAGWVVYLDANNNNAFDAGETTATSDAFGNYSFANVAAGTNIVRQIFQSGYRRTLPIPPVNNYSV